MTKIKIYYKVLQGIEKEQFLTLIAHNKGKFDLISGFLEKVIFKEKT
jgi:hypothetical protein